MTRIVKDPDERRSELIAAAQQLFYSRGYERTAVRDIVDAVGVAKGTFYYYFDSKPAILEALLLSLTEQALRPLRATVADPSLPALEKWQQAFGVAAAWKTARRDELIAVLRVMQDPDNVRLQTRHRRLSIEMMAPEIAKIIVQGVNEGVFATDYPEDKAEIAMRIFLSAFDLFSDYILHPERHPNRLALARRKLAAMQDAVERLLGADSGALPLVEDAVIVAWFEGA